MERASRMSMPFWEVDAEGTVGDGCVMMDEIEVSGRTGMIDAGTSTRRRQLDNAHGNYDRSAIGSWQL